MSDARWDDPRECGERDRDDERPRVYDERDRHDRDRHDGLMRDLDLPRGEDRELVVWLVRIYYTPPVSRCFRSALAHAIASSRGVRVRSSRGSNPRL